MHLMDEFARAFHSADRVVLLDIYAASEAPIEGVTAQSLAARMREFGHRNVQYAGSNEAGVKEVIHGAKPGDFIITLGAGSVSQLGEKILESLKANA
jgi:UDP-N-acetylmuramate--alanine ligase